VARRAAGASEGGAGGVIGAVEIYLAIGVVLLVAGTILIVSTEYIFAKSGSRLGDLAHSVRSSSWEDWLGNVIITVLIVTLWPALLAWGGFSLIKDLFWKRSDGLLPRMPQEPVFRVRRRHLRGTQSIEEIEEAERVTDPLGAVPDLPFGHLNAAWRRFVSTIPPGGALARFSAQWERGRYLVEHLEGYVVVQDGRPGAHWVSSRERVDPRDAVVRS
jgi:hypothetical protein